MVGLIVFFAVGVMLGMALWITILVAWAVRREDTNISLAGRSPNPFVRAVRRLLGIHLIGITPSDEPPEGGPGRPQSVSRAHSRACSKDRIV